MTPEMSDSTSPADRSHFMVVGTDTDVGKTAVSLLLMQYLFDEGARPFYLKPFQTGCTDAHAPDSDARFVYAHTPALRDKDPSDAVICCHTLPKAPYFAALAQGEQIDVTQVLEKTRAKAREASPLIVEAAGGLLVPITRDLLMIDFARQLGFEVILVGRAGLGTINHTLLSIEALRSRNIPLAGVVLVDGGEVPSPPDMIQENIAAVELFSGIKVSGVIGRIDDFSRPAPDAFLPIAKLVDRGT